MNVAFHRSDSRDPVVVLKDFPVAAHRLELLQNERDDSGAIGRRIQFEMMDLRETIGKIDAQIRELKTLYRLTDDHQQVKTAVKDRDGLRDKLLRLNEHGKMTSSRTTGQLYGACERFVLSGRSLSPAKEVKPDLKRGEAVSDAVERLRARLTELETERARVRDAPLPSSFAKEKMRQQVNDLANRGRPDVRALVQSGSDIGWPTTNQLALIANLAPDTNRGACAQWSEPDARALVCWLHQDAMIQKLDKEIASVADDKAALSPEDRNARLAELDDMTLETERLECDLVWQVAETGAPLALREDASPKAVLGLA